MQSRKEFLAAGALAALVPQIASAQATPAPASPSATLAPKSAAQDDFPKLDFDLKAFDAALAKTATHRNLFTSTTLDEGHVLQAMRNTLNAYEDIGVAMADILPAAVLYHGFSVLMAFNDAAWNDLFIPAQVRLPKKLRDDFGTVKANAGNPYLHAPHPDSRDSLAMEKLTAQAGAQFFVCNNATRGVAGSLGKMLSLKPVEVYDRLTKSLVANAMLVPAGVWAVHAVQEHRFTLLQATV